MSPYRYPRKMCCLRQAKRQRLRPTSHSKQPISVESQAEALQKAVQNPVASLISVPLQNNTNMSYGPYNRTQDVLNLQPVIPVKLSMGPSVVLLAQPPHWTIGVLINNVWSVAGSEHRPPVNQMPLQYFLNYTMKKGWYLQMAPIITANWRASSGNVWTAPVGGGGCVGKIMKLGCQPINWQAEFYGNAAYLSGGSSWTFRSQIAFLFRSSRRKRRRCSWRSSSRNWSSRRNLRRKIEVGL
ncbi:MAG TPA: hypothetical protein VF772_05165 [Terriglobales bacterium]